MKDLALIRNIAVANLADIGYVFAEDNVKLVFALNESEVLVLGYDEEEGLWYVDYMRGDEKSGYEFDYNAMFFEEYADALEYYNNIVF